MRDGSTRLLRLGPPSVLLALALAGLGFLITSPQGLFNEYSDLGVQHLATQGILHEAWRSRDAGWLWRSDQLSGFPAATNPQATYSHPVHVLFALFSPPAIVGFVMWLEMVLAGIGGYLAAGALGCDRAGRLMTAIGMLFSFKVVLAVYAGWLPVLAAVVAMPFVFAAAVFVLERPSGKSALLFGAAVTLALHVGHPQLMYYTALFLGVWSLWRLGRDYVLEERRRAREALIALGLGAAMALGLSAYRLLPIASDLGLVTRSADTAFFLGNAPFPAWGLLTLLGPEYFGNSLDGSLPEAWEFVLYLGVVPLALIAAEVVWGRPRPHIAALRVGFVISAVLAIDSPVLRFAAEVLPGYRHFRIPARILFLTAFFGYCLAGVGLDEVLRRTPARARSAVATVLIALVAVEGTYWARRYLREPNPIPYPVQAPYLDALRSSEPARVAPLSIALINPGSAEALGLQLVTGYDPFILRHYQTYMDVMQEGHALGRRSTVRIELDRVARWDLLDALNVEYLVSPSPLDPGDSGFALAGAYADQPQFAYYHGMVRAPAYVYRNDRFLRRAFFVSEVRTVTDEQAMLDEILRTNIRDVAVTLGARGGASAPGAHDRVEVLHSSGGVLELSVQNERPRFLVISEIWHPGWRALVDNRAAPLVRADIALQGLWLEPGAHHVEIRFWPPGLTAGLIVSAVTAGAVILAVAVLARRERWRRR